MIWLGVLFVAILWTAFETPISFVLDFKIEESHLWLDGFFCSIFLIDVFLRLTNRLKLPENTKDSLTEENKDPKPYYKTLWFPVDLFTSIPFDIIAALLGLGVTAQVLNVLRLCRIVRVVKLRSLLSILELLPKPVKVVMVASTVMLAIHWIACSWMLINPRPELDYISYYNVSLYWAVTTLTTVGYGDITPSTNIGRLFTMGVMLIGVGVYGIIIGNFSRLMMQADKYAEEKKEKMNNLKQFMKYYTIPRSLQKQVFSFYNHLLTKKLSEEDSQIINDLPHSLQNELNIYMKIKLIRNVHIFKDSSIPCLKMIAERLEQTCHNPNEYIVRKGDIGEEMFIIGHGDVQVLVGEQVVAELKAGQFFGEFALLEDTIRTADIQAKTYCDMYTFKKNYFLEVIEKYPELGVKFSQTRRKRESDNKASKIQAKRAA